MNFVWRKNRDMRAEQLIFSLRLDTPCDELTLCAADSYEVYADGKLISYGPERTAAGYARRRTLPTVGVRELEVRVLAHGTPCYECDCQLPYFGAELISGGHTVYNTESFSCHENCQKLANMPRYSVQRGYAEGYDLFLGRKPVETEAVEAPVILDGVGDTADYAQTELCPVCEGEFPGFDKIVTPHWAPRLGDPGEGRLDVTAMLLTAAREKRYYSAFSLPGIRTGFLRLELDASEDSEAAIVFYELTPSGERIYRRSQCNDVIYLKIPAGRNTVITAEPYALMYLEAVTLSGKVTVTPTLISYENSTRGAIKVSAEEKFMRVFRAAEGSFRQNAVDLFTDCPGRERAGWLCDSFFTARAEALLLGSNRIEGCFIENYILSDTPELPDGMIPMCYPSEHNNSRYIPNWAMWFVLELEDYLLRTGDRELVDKAKEKALGVVRFFDKYKNEYGLLEDLESWVFVEWSVANDADYVCGVNFPSNMLYARMLEAAGRLYGEPQLCREGEALKRTVKELAYNGRFFVDNATRDAGGKLCPRGDHISETCQYYALWMGLDCDADFCERMVREFGPKRTDAYPEIGRSNMFIGNYLRFFWLTDIGEYDRVLDESVEYFGRMAEVTGTLWEHDRPTASCVHGFTSVAAVILLSATVGYEGMRSGRQCFKKGFKGTGRFGVSVEYTV